MTSYFPELLLSSTTSQAGCYASSAASAAATAAAVPARLQQLHQCPLCSAAATAVATSTPVEFDCPEGGAPGSAARAGRLLSCCCRRRRPWRGAAIPLAGGRTALDRRPADLRLVLWQRLPRPSKAEAFRNSLSVSRRSWSLSRSLRTCHPRLTTLRPKATRMVAPPAGLAASGRCAAAAAAANVAQRDEVQHQGGPCRSPRTCH